LSDAAGSPIRLAIALDDAELGGRLAVLLAAVAGITLVRDGAPADAVIGPPGMPAQAEADPPLTAREQEVLLLLAEGASNKTVARRLGISVHTAKFHVGQLLDKLEATGRTDAVAHAARLGIIHL
jgi:DNA-binding CsgD family transcriptional regulator